MSDDPRFSHYTRDYYVGRACPESQSYEKHILRPGDMGAALCYAFGVDSYAEACALLGIPQDNPRALPDTTFIDQLCAIQSAAQRQPNHILEVGCGRGELSATAWYYSIPYVGLEPSAAGLAIAKQTRTRWSLERPDMDISTQEPAASHWLSSGCSSLLVQEGLADYMAGLPEDAGFPHDTVLFVESIEHIPEPEFSAAWPLLVRMLRFTSGRLVIVNWIDYHPIVPDGSGWDHVRPVDDAFYDALAADAKRTVFRQGSHLVLEF